jgi:protein-tyrosine phosphatase
MDFAPNATVLEVPDPYYTGGFDEVYRMVRSGCEGLLALIRREHSL